MKVTIFGGGNVGTQLAVHSAAKGHDVTIYSPKAYLFAKQLSIVNEDNCVIMTGDVSATDDMKKACEGAQLIFVTFPATMMEKFAKDVVSYLQPGTYIGLIPGTGGAECAFRESIEKGCVVFGLQRVPSVARLVTYGKCVKASGYRKDLFAAAIPRRYTENACDIVSGILDMPCHALPNYLSVTLTPSNPILHTTRLYSIFNEYQQGKVYKKIPLFYEEWSEEASELLLACDEEVQNICSKLSSSFDLSNVISLKKHYESDTPQMLTKKIRSIKSLQGIETPSKPVQGGYEPDLKSRYFTADFPYGLEIIVQIADLVDVAVPNCKKVLRWYYELVGKTQAFSYEEKGIKNRAALESFYLE